MSIKLNITSNINEITKSLNTFVQKQVPFAIAMALNDATRDAQKAVQQAMKGVFNNPVSRTMNGVKIKTGTKAKPETAIWIDDEPNKGIAPAKYLAAEIVGGVRHLKRFERALQAKGLMPPGTFAVPGPGAPLDGNGNIPGSFIVQLLSYLGSFSERGYRANMTQKRKAKLHGIKIGSSGYKTISGVMYFVSSGTGRTSHFEPGIYRKTGTHGSNVVPVILFVRSASYNVRLKFGKVVEDTVNERFGVRMKEQLAKALATAK